MSFIKKSTGSEGTSSEQSDDQDNSRISEGDGVAVPLIEYQASRFKGRRVITPNLIRIWPDRIEEFEPHALKKKTLRAINYFQISQITVKTGTLFSDVSVESTGGLCIVLTGIKNEYVNHVKSVLDNAVEQVRRGNIPITTNPEQSTSGSNVEFLIRLGDMHKAGLLTDQEFEEQKAKLLKPPSE